MFEDLGLTAVWSPKIGQEFGMRLQYRLKENWSFGSGIQWVRRNYSIEFHYQNDTLAINDFDTIPKLTTVGYRDIYPITVGGKIFTTFVVFIGMGMVAIPTGLLASSFVKTFNDKSRN